MEIEPTELERFLKSRKSEQTRKYTKLLLKYLIEAKEKNNEDCVRSRDLKKALVSPEKIPNNSSFYQLLMDLANSGFIERVEKRLVKRQKGKNPTFYRITPSKLKSIGGTIDLLSQASVSGVNRTKRERECEQELRIAKQMLIELGIKNPDEEIEQRKG